MEAKVKIVSVELNHEDLINIFSTALYGNSAMECLYRKSDYGNIPFLLTDTREEVIAKILMGGGEVTIIDNEGAEECVDDVCHYGKKGKNWQSNGVIDMGGYYKCYSPMYKVNLRNILNGIKTERGYELAKSLLIDENGDMWTAYNLLQVVLFGEEIYG